MVSNENLTTMMTSRAAAKKTSISTRLLGKDKHLNCTSMLENKQRNKTYIYIRATEKLKEIVLRQLGLSAVRQDVLLHWQAVLLCSTSHFTALLAGCAASLVKLDVGVCALILRSRRLAHARGAALLPGAAIATPPCADTHTNAHTNCQHLRVLIFRERAQKLKVEKTFQNPPLLLLLY